VEVHRAEYTPRCRELTPEFERESRRFRDLTRDQHGRINARGFFEAMAMEYKDYYAILGVPRTASEKEIKAAYRRLARKFHPDMNKGAAKSEAKFKEINEANEVLSDPVKRRRYDTLGANWDSMHTAQHRGAGRVHADFGGSGNLGGFSDFFRTFFGGGFGGGSEGGMGGLEDLFEGGAGRARASDLEANMDLTLEEAIRGATRAVQIGERRVEVKIPAGVREGVRVRVAGGAGAAGGDVYLRVRLVPHPQFERAGDDLQTTVTVPLTTAVLGGEVSVPTLDGARGIKVPAASRVGQMFRLAGEGLPRQQGGRGDLLARLSVELPKKLSPRETELFTELRALGR
jgi:curved DNA-binding protein